MTRGDMRKIRVLITGTGGRSVGYEVLTCLRKFPERYTTIATDADPFSAGIYEADKGYLLPFASDQSYMERLLTIAQDESVDAVIPGSNPEVVLLANNVEQLEALGIVLIANPKALVNAIANKINQYILLQAYGFTVPKFLPTSGSLPHRLPFDFPFIAKPSKDHQGSKNVFIVKDFAELEQIFETTSRTNTEMLLQEYVGSPNDEYTVGVVVDKTGKAIDAMVMKRKLYGLSLLTERTINNKYYAVSTSHTQGEFVENRQIKEYCMHVAETLGARGPFNVQLRLTERGVTIFEVHTRFSGSASQRAEAGFNEPDAIVRNFVLGEAIQPFSYRTDIAIIRQFKNVVVKKANIEKISKKNGIANEIYSRNRGDGVYRATHRPVATQSRVQGSSNHKRGRPKKSA